MNFTQELIDKATFEDPMIRHFRSVLSKIR